MLKCLTCGYSWNKNIGDICPRCGSLRSARRARAIEIVISWIVISFVILAGSYLLSLILFSGGFRPSGF